MRSALLVTMSMIAMLSACSASDTTAVDPVVGTYSLASVNGLPVPAVTQNDATIKTEILSGTFVINSASFNESRQGRITVNGGTPSTITATQSGTWSQSGAQLSFLAGTTQNPVTFTGTFVAGTLTYTSSGSTFVYLHSITLCPSC